MKMTDISGGDLRANNDTIGATNVAQLVAAGAETSTFAGMVRFILVTSVTHAVWIAKDATAIAAAAGGAISDRVYLPAGSTGIVLPWSGDDVWFVNATAGESPSIYVVGWY